MAQGWRYFSLDELLRHFPVVDLAFTNAVWRLVVKPKNASPIQLVELIGVDSSGVNIAADEFIFAQIK